MARPTRRNRNAEVDFRGERRSNAAHAATTDPDARLFRKSPGAGAMPCFMGHRLMENRTGLIVRADLTGADGHAERRAAIDMAHRLSPGSSRHLTLAADRCSTAPTTSPSRAPCARSLSTARAAVSARALAWGEDRPGAALARQVGPEVDPLRHGEAPDRGRTGRPSMSRTRPAGARNPGRTGHRPRHCRPRGRRRVSRGEAGCRPAIPRLRGWQA